MATIFSSLIVNIVFDWIESKQIAKDGFKKYISNFNNKVDVGGLLVFATFFVFTILKVFYGHVCNLDILHFFIIVSIMLKI